MRRIAIINQKGGVGKTTTAVNLGAALARLGRRVVVIDMDPQANASMNLGAELDPEDPSTYSILTQGGRVEDTLRGTSTPGLSIIPSHLDLSGAELELASAIGRETILRDALDEWERDEIERSGRSPADVVLIDNPPSLGLLSVNGLAASHEVLIAVQTEFFALQGLSKLVQIVQLLRRRLNPELEITGVLACLYDSRLRLAREVLGELRAHFPVQLFKRPIAQNVKLAESPSFSRTIFEYAPESKGAEDYLAVAREFLAREGVENGADGRAIEPRTAAAPPVEAEPEPESAVEAAEPVAEPELADVGEELRNGEELTSEAGGHSATSFAPPPRSEADYDDDPDSAVETLFESRPGAPKLTDVELADPDFGWEAQTAEARASEALPPTVEVDAEVAQSAAKSEDRAEFDATAGESARELSEADPSEIDVAEFDAAEQEAPEADAADPEEPVTVVTPAPRRRTPVRSRTDDRGEERTGSPAGRGPVPG